MKKNLQLTILTLSTLLFFWGGNILGQNTYVLNLQDENHYFQIDDNVANDLDLGTSYTIEAWVYIKNTTHGNERIFRSQGWQMYVVSGTGASGADAKIRIDGTFLTAGGSITLDNVSTEEWHHICLMSNGTWTNNYIDGVAEDNGGGSNITGSTNLRIGSYSLASTDLIGALDEIRISNNERYSRWGFTVNKDDAPFTSDANTVLLFHFDDNTEFPPSNSSSKAFTITNYGVDASDYFAFDDASFSGTLSLPVELTDFTVSIVDGGVMLNWSTATEVNNYGFEIEKLSGDEWEYVDFIEGHGNSNTPQNYSYLDEAPIIGKVSYRLKQVDTDGGYEYSNEVSAVSNEATYKLNQNYPNPFNPTTVISFSLKASSKVTLTVYNSLGQQVASLVNEVMDAGYHEVNFNGSNLASGFYVYRLDAPGYSKTMKMMLLK